MNALDLIARPDIAAAALLLVVAAAAGINLYVTLGTLGLVSRIGAMPALPPGLTGLENGLVITTACALLLVEAAADREHAFAGMWHSLHAIVKPLAAALLAASAFAGSPPWTLAAACALAGGTSLLFHAIRYGARIARRMPDAPRGGARITLGEALLAGGLLLTLRFREAAVPVAAVLVLAAVIAGPAGYRAFRLGIAAQQARLRSFLGTTGWSGIEALPAGLRRAVPPTPLAGTPPRATRVGILRAPGFRRFTRGWLISDGASSRLMARSLRGPRVHVLSGDAPLSIRQGSWADLVESGGAPSDLRFLLLKDGPAAALVARTVAAEPTTGRRVPPEKP